jgi:hypothetical protein
LGEEVLEDIAVMRVKVIHKDDHPGYVTLVGNGIETFTEIEYCYRVTEENLKWTKSVAELKSFLYKLCFGINGCEIYSYFHKHWTIGLDSDKRMKEYILDRLEKFCNSVVELYNSRVDGVSIFRRT